MSQIKSKSNIIIAAVIGTLVVAAGVLVPMYFFVWKPESPTSPTWDLEFFGDEVAVSKNVTYQEIIEEFTATDFSFNYTKWKDAFFSTEICNYTGVPLWDLIQFSGVDYGRANAIRFIAYDHYDPLGLGTELGGSPTISLDVVENNKSLIIVAFKEEGVILTGPEEDGDGYLISAVNYSVNEEIKSSNYKFKNLIGIQFMIDWELSLYGESPLVEETKTISYQEILNNPNLTRYENIQVNYTKSSSELVTVSAVSLWSIIEEVDLNYTTANTVNFTSAFSDYESKASVPLDWVENNESMVLVVYAVDGELLDPNDDGYLFSLVDYELDQATSSSWYKVKFLDGIKFFEL